MAITIDVGKIKLVWRGTYNGSTPYVIDDLVQYDDGVTNSAYICVADSTGNVPSTSGTTDESYWNLVAKGASANAEGTADGQIQYKSGVGFAASTLLVYDATNSRFGIGTTNPTATLTVNGSSSVGDLYVSGITTLGVTTSTSYINFTEVHEKTQITAGTANGTSNLDVVNGTVFLFTTNSTSTWTHNIRGDGSTTLNSLLEIGQAITVTVISKQNNTSYYTANITIDGSAQTEYWYNATPSSGQSTTGYDVYTWNIIKTADATFTVLANQSLFG